MGHVLSLESELKRKACIEADSKRTALENRFAIALLREPDEDKGIIYNLVDEYGLETVCNMLERRRV